MAVVAVTGMLCPAVAVAADSSFVVTSFVAVSVVAVITVARSAPEFLVAVAMASVVEEVTALAAELNWIDAVALVVLAVVAVTGADAPQAFATYVIIVNIKNVKYLTHDTSRFVIEKAFLCHLILCSWSDRFDYSVLSLASGFYSFGRSSVSGTSYL